MKFDALQPSRGTFNYGNADRIVAQAKANGMNMRCHALVWHSQVPSWVSNGNFDRTTMISILETHIRNVVTHFKGACYAWDVVNEALNEDGTYRTTDSVWYRTIGVDYIPLAFKPARAADPNAKLYYNDYNCDRPGRKATGAQNLIRMVRDAGAPIDGMGLQGHMTTGQIGSLATLTENLRAFANLNVDVANTELDMVARSGSSQFQKQATDWATVVQACLAVARCVGITGWGFTDAHTWIGGGNPLIWDASYQKKPAYNAILTAWGSSSGTPLTTPPTTPPPSGNPNQHFKSQLPVNIEAVADQSSHLRPVFRLLLNRKAQSDIMAPNGISGQHGEPASQSGKKRVLIVGAGAAGMSAAHHLSQHRDRFDVTLIDAVDYCGGQAFSIPLDKERYGASWCNQGVQGGSYIFHHTFTMFNRQGYQADPVNLHVSFGKDETFWTNVFPTKVLAEHQSEVRRFAKVLKFMRWFEVFFALLPLRLVLKMFFFSEDFINIVALPMTALFLGTGNATPEVPAVMLERLCTSPTYGMWYPANENTVVDNKPPMRSKKGVTVRLRARRPPEDSHNPAGADQDIPPQDEFFDELVLCTLADTAKRVLSKTASWRERKVLGSAKFSDDITITHNDSDYMKKHYENFYRDDLAIRDTNGVDQSGRLEEAKTSFRPMYYIKMYDQDRQKLEMCFDTTNYQSQFPEKVPFEQHVFQTIYLNKDRGSELWSDNEIAEDKIIRKDWWHQLCHSYTHYLLVVPWIMFLQARNSVRFGGSWTLVNAHEVAIISGLAAAVDLGADYPEDLENDRFAFLCFRLYYLLSYGKWYRRKYSKGAPTTQLARDGASWPTSTYGGVYQGPGVATEERRCWRQEMKTGRSTDNLAQDNGGRSQP
ncbi:Cutinase [Verticillium dahliae VDG1]|nr:Cutinase [Verticillium dahliae VDG1]